MEVHIRQSFGAWEPGVHQVYQVQRSVRLPPQRFTNRRFDRKPRCGVASYWRSFQTVGYVKRVEVHNLLSPKEAYGLRCTKSKIKGVKKVWGVKKR